MIETTTKIVCSLLGNICLTDKKDLKDPKFKDEMVGQALGIARRIIEFVERDENEIDS